MDLNYYHMYNWSNDAPTNSKAPFEDITEDEYNVRINTLKAIDLNKVMEIDDNVEFSQVAACAGGACEIA